MEEEAAEARPPTVSSCDGIRVRIDLSAAWMVMVVAVRRGLCGRVDAGRDGFEEGRCRAGVLAVEDGTGCKGGVRAQCSWVP